MLRDNFAKLTKYAREPQRQRLARRKLDGPPNQAAQLSVRMHFHDAVTGIFSAAVNTQDAHVSAVYRGDASDPSRRVKSTHPASHHATVCDGGHLLEASMNPGWPILSRFL